MKTTKAELQKQVDVALARCDDLERAKGLLKEETKTLTDALRKAESELWVAKNLESSVASSVERSNKLLERLAPGVDMERAKERFTAWVGVELDRRAKFRSEVPGMPAAIRGAQTADLELWNSDVFRRAEAIRLAVLVTLREGDTSRDVTVRWPGAT